MNEFWGPYIVKDNSPINQPYFRSRYPFLNDTYLNVLRAQRAIMDVIKRRYKERSFRLVQRSSIKERDSCCLRLNVFDGGTITFAE